MILPWPVQLEGGDAVGEGLGHTDPIIVLGLCASLGDNFVVVVQAGLAGGAATESLGEVAGIRGDVRADLGRVLGRIGEAAGLVSVHVGAVLSKLN